jgi:hypothetical protein
MDQTSQPERRRRGRPALPEEAHRRRLTVRFDPALLHRLETAAAKAGHSLTQEIEERCASHEALLALSYNYNESLRAKGIPIREVDVTVDSLVDSLHRILSIVIRNRDRPAEEQQSADDDKARYWQLKLEGDKP